MIVIDRFEGDYAVVEIGGSMVDVPRALLPEQAVEGSSLIFVMAPVDDRMADAVARLARLAARGTTTDDVDL
jgi:Protein of unknown function (DUF3006)